MKNVDITAAIRIIAERRIEQAMKEGKFDNLPGAGKPIDVDDAPAEENARLTWWALRILRQNGVIPDEVQLRREIEQLKSRLIEEPEAQRRIAMAKQLNDMIRRLNSMGTNAMNHASAHAPLDIGKDCSL